VTEPAVRFDRVSKRFPGAQALTDVSFEIAAGSCHALCGENGAGKSTLGKIVAGIHQPDGGRLFVGGTEVRFNGPRDALAAGVGMVHQELAFCDNLSVAENLCLSALPRRATIVDRDEMRRRAEALLAETGTRLDVEQTFGKLPIGQRQMVQIAAAVGGGARIIVFDEPTSSLSQAEAERLFELIERLKARGVTCIYVSHRMPEIYRLCDTISVLRDGRHVATRPAATLSESELVTLMIGRELGDYLPQTEERHVGKELLRLDRLSVPGKFRDVSFTLHEGEIVGLAGLVGAGRSEIAQTIFGLEKASSGRVFVDARPARIAEPKDAIALGIGLVPEDRKRQGLVLGESGAHNTTLPILRRLSRALFVRRREEETLASTFFSTLRVRTPSLAAPVAGLSGGNQQKLAIGKWLAMAPRLLLMDEPTAGMAPKERGELMALTAELTRERGLGVLFTEHSMDVVFTYAQRVLVMARGRLIAQGAPAVVREDPHVQEVYLGTGATFRAQAVGV